MTGRKRIQLKKRRCRPQSRHVAGSAGELCISPTISTHKMAIPLTNFQKKSTIAPKENGLLRCTTVPARHTRNGVALHSWHARRSSLCFAMKPRQGKASSQQRTIHYVRHLVPRRSLATAPRAAGAPRGGVRGGRGPGALRRGCMSSSSSSFSPKPQPCRRRAAAPHISSPRGSFRRAPVSGARRLSTCYGRRLLCYPLSSTPPK